MTEEKLVFSYRPWLFLRRRSVELPSGSYRLGRGLVCPIIRLEDDEGSPISVVRLAPRYRYHDEELVEALSLSGVEDMAMRRGIKAIVAWLREIGGRGGREATRLASQLREGLKA